MIHQKTVVIHRCAYGGPRLYHQLCLSTWQFISRIAVVIWCPRTTWAALARRSGFQHNCHRIWAFSRISGAHFSWRLGYRWISKYCRRSPGSSPCPSDLSPTSS